MTLCDQFLYQSPQQIEEQMKRMDADRYARFLASLQKPDPTESESQMEERFTLMDQFEREALHQLHSAQSDLPAVWDLSRNRWFQTAWWSVASPQVNQFLATVCVQYQLDPEGQQVHLVFLDNRRPSSSATGGLPRLTYAEVQSLQQTIHGLLSSRGLFNYEQLVQALIKSVVKIVSEKCRDFLDVALLETIYARKTVPFGEEWSAGFDIAFEGGGDHGNVVAYPDANNFNAVLLKYWYSIARIPGRVYVDFFARCLKACSHEVVHCIQSKHRQVDPDPLSWSAEHDASFLAGSLMAAACREPALQTQLGEGWWEWLMLDWALECEHQHSRYRGYTQEQYLLWRNAFGLVPPAEDVVKARRGVMHYLKNIISFEAMSFSPDVLQIQLEACFRDRTGDVYQASIHHLDQVKVYRDFDEILHKGF